MYVCICISIYVYISLSLSLYLNLNMYRVYMKTHHLREEVLFLCVGHGAAVGPVGGFHIHLSLSIQIYKYIKE